LILCLYLKLDAGIVAASSLMSLGTGLFSKERFEQSPEARRQYSMRPSARDARDIASCVFAVGLALPLGPRIEYPSKFGRVGFAWFMGFAIILSAVGVGCAGTEKMINDASEAKGAAKGHAEEMRDELDAVALEVAKGSGLVESVCAFRGERSTECTVPRAALANLQRLDQGARAAIAWARHSLKLEPSRPTSRAAPKPCSRRFASWAHQRPHRLQHL
jgi:hypothetical protein